MSLPAGPVDRADASRDVAAPLRSATALSERREEASCRPASTRSYADSASISASQGVTLGMEQPLGSGLTRADSIEVDGAADSPLVRIGAASFSVAAPYAEVVDTNAHFL